MPYRVNRRPKGSPPGGTEEGLTGQPTSLSSPYRTPSQDAVARWHESARLVVGNVPRTLRLLRLGGVIVPGDGSFH